jgi:hypothetical protein
MWPCSPSAAVRIRFPPFTIGGGQNTLSAMNENPVLAFVFDVKGLIADMSIKGAKSHKLDMTEKKE